MHTSSPTFSVAAVLSKKKMENVAKRCKSKTCTGPTSG